VSPRHFRHELAVFFACFAIAAAHAFTMSPFYAVKRRHHVSREFRHSMIAIRFSSRGAVR
jgi:hypothetical protein